MNILISIKSLFRGEGFKAAQGELAATKTAAADVKLPQQLEAGAASADKSIDKLNKQLRGTNSALNATQALARGDVFGALNQASAALSEKLGQLGKQMGAAFAGFGIGWQIGTMIRELTGLGKALDNLIVPPEIAAKSIRTMASERLGGLRAELEATKARMEGLTKAADDAAKRVQLAIDSKIAKREQAGVQAEQAAPEPDKPVIAANTALDVARQELEIARAKTAEEKKAADATAAAIDAERQRLALAEQNVKEAQHIFSVYKELGKSAEVAVDVVTAEERVATLKKQIEDLQKTAELQGVQVQTAQTSEVRAQTAVMKAEGGVKDAEAKRKEDQQTEAKKRKDAIAAQWDLVDEDAAKAKAKADAQAKAEQKQKLELAQKDAKAEAEQKKQQAEEKRTASEKDLEQSAKFRSFVLSPRLRVEADREARDAEKTQKKDDRTYQSLLKRAQAAGYKANENAEGDFDITRDTRIAGTRSKRLADVVRAEAERMKGEREKKEANALEENAKRAQIDSAFLLAKIAKNTEQGPIV